MIMGMDGTEPAEDYVSPLLMTAAVDFSTLGGSLLKTASESDRATILQIFLGIVGWAANKSFEVLKFKFKFPRARTFELF